MRGTTKVFGRVLLAGWIVLFISGLLIVEFPNADWNHALSSVVWVLSIVVLLATLAFCALVAVRLAQRIFGRATRPPSGSTDQASAASTMPWSRRLKIGLVVVLAATVFVALLLVVIEREIRSSIPYQMSLAQALHSPLVLSATGQPVRAGWLVKGQIAESTNGRGHAELTIPLNGPNGSGTLRVEAFRRAGSWKISTLQFVPSGGETSVDISSGRQAID
jgi:hypothetical protein